MTPPDNLLAEARAEEFDAHEMLKPFTGRKPVIGKYTAAHTSILQSVVARLDETDREAADVLVWMLWWRTISENRSKIMCDRVGELTSELNALTQRKERLAAALEGARAWIVDTEDEDPEEWEIVKQIDTALNEERPHG